MAFAVDSIFEFEISSTSSPVEQFTQKNECRCFVWRRKVKRRGLLWL